MHASPRRYVKNAEIEAEFHEQKREALQEKKRQLVSNTFLHGVLCTTSSGLEVADYQHKR